MVENLDIFDKLLTLINIFRTMCVLVILIHVVNVQTIV